MRRGSLKKDFTIRLEDDDPYLQAIRDGWGGAIHKAFHGHQARPGLDPLDRPRGNNA